METCYIDDCQKKEWLKLRQLRLQQVREKSKVIAKDVLRKAKEKQEEQKVLARINRENVLQEWKSAKIQELEQKYNDAMKKVGLAIKDAEMEPDADIVLKTNKIKDDQVAHIRGKRAEKILINTIHDAREKENAPIRRKEIIREIEDIRSGLIVQSRDWNVINQTGRQVLLRVPLPNVDEFQVNQPKQKLPFSLSPSLKTLKSSRATTSPKLIKKSVRVTPYSSPKRSPLVPNLDDLKSSRSENPRLQECVGNIEEPLVEFYDHQAQYSRNYRLGGKLVERVEDNKMDFPKYVDNPCRQPCSILPERVPSENDDEELSLLLKKYTSSQNSEIINLSDSSKDKTPVKKTKKSAKELAYTPPTKENDFIPRKTNTRRSSALKSNRNKKDNNSETKKLFEAIDKALEDGRKLRNESSIKSCMSSNSSQSDSDTEAIVKLVVNVNCGQHNSLEMDKKSDLADKGCQVEEMKKSVGTEIGTSLTERCDDDLIGISPIRRVKKRMKIKKKIGNNKCECKQYGCCSNCYTKPMQRSSTLQDLAGKKVPETVCDMSSIYNEPQIFSETKMRETKVKSTESLNSVLSQSTWCQTSYLSPPNQKTSEDTKEETNGSDETFPFNPELDYYIRKLLDLPPDPCESSECTECRCQSARSISSQASSSSSHNQAESALRIEIDVSGDQQRVVTEESQKSGNVSNSNHCTEMDSTCFKSLPSNKTADASCSIKSSDYEAETKRRLERIAYLKQELEKIRMDKHLIETSSSLGSSSGKSKSHSSSEFSSQASEKGIIQNTSSKDSRRDAGTRLEGPHHLSAIMEVDSRLIASSLSSSSASIVSDIVGDLKKRGIITSPFNWSQGESLSEQSDFNVEDGAIIEPSLNFTTTAKTDAGTTFNTLHSANTSRPPLLNLSLSTNQSASAFASFDRPEVTFDLGSPERDLDQILHNLNVSKK